MSRADKVAHAMQKEISLILHDEIKDPRIGFVTITKVELAPDLRLAKIYFSVLGSEEERKKTKEALDSALKFIRRLVAERINLKFAPEILFREDKSTEYSVRIQQILEEINPVRGKTPKVSDGCLRQPASNGVKEQNEFKKNRRSRTKK